MRPAAASTGRFGRDRLAPRATPRTRSGRMTPRRLVATLAIVNVLCAPVSWFDEGVTPSWVVYPLALLLGLWRLRRGKGLVFLAVAAGVFLVVHLPWSFAFLTDGEHPIDRDLEYSPLQWFLTLLVAPLALEVAALWTWLRERAPLRA
jgi:hypothetical protein